jgi:Protein of unknown function (DUF3040)
MITPFERRQLRLIEEWFEQDDPDLARILRSGPAKKSSTLPQMVAVCVTVALGVLGVLTGAFMLIFGAMISGVVAGCLLVSRRKEQGPDQGRQRSVR